MTGAQSSHTHNVHVDVTAISGIVALQTGSGTHSTKRGYCQTGRHLKVNRSSVAEPGFSENGRNVH